MSKTKIRITYGIFSYGVAATLLLMPLIPNAEMATLPRVIPFLSGAFLLISALVTDFEVGFARLLRFRDNALMVALGSFVVLTSTALLNYGNLQLLMVLLAAMQTLLAAVAFKLHYVNRHRFV